MFTQLAVIFPLYFINYGAASCLNFCSLTLSVWLVSCYIYIQLERVYLRNVRGLNWPFQFSLSLLFVSESLLGNTPVTIEIVQKCLGIFSSKSRTTYFFRSLYLISYIFMSPPMPKIIADTVYQQCLRERLDF